VLQPCDLQQRTHDGNVSCTESGFIRCTYKSDVDQVRVPQRSDALEVVFGLAVVQATIGDSIGRERKDLFFAQHYLPPRVDGCLYSYNHARTTSRLLVSARAS
jgi:hypothetical protein